MTSSAAVGWPLGMTKELKQEHDLGVIGDTLLIMSWMHFSLPAHPVICFAGMWLTRVRLV